MASFALAGLSFIAAAKPKMRLTRALNDSRVAVTVVVTVAVTVTVAVAATVAATAAATATAVEDDVEDNIINPDQAFCKWQPLRNSYRLRALPTVSFRTVFPGLQLNLVSF